MDRVSVINKLIINITIVQTYKYYPFTQSINEFRSYFLRIISEKMPINKPTNSLAALNLYREFRRAKSNGKVF